jgi:hypothetical protein
MYPILSHMTNLIENAPTITHVGASLLTYTTIVLSRKLGLTTTATTATATSTTATAIMTTSKAIRTSKTI